MGIKGLIGKPNFFKPENQNYSEGVTLIETDATANKFDCELEPENKQNIPLKELNTIEIKENDLVNETENLRLTVEALQKKLLKQEANIPSKWIIQNVSTFPKLPLPMKKLMSSANTLRPYATLVMDWFLKPLGLKPGRESFAGWEFRVNPSDFMYTKNILKELSGRDFSLADIIDWSSLQNSGSKRGFGQGNSENLKKTGGVTSWFYFLKVFLEWAFVVVDIQPAMWVLNASS